RSFPFSFSRQARILPTRIGVCFIKTDMTHRLAGIQQLQPIERELMPPSVDTLPVQRSLPAPLLAFLPTIGQPEFRTLIRSCFYKFQIFGVIDQSVSDAESFDKNAMVGGLVIKTKSIRGTGTHMGDAGLVLYPLEPPLRRLLFLKY